MPVRIVTDSTCDSAAHGDRRPRRARRRRPGVHAGTPGLKENGVQFWTLYLLIGASSSA